MDKINNSKGIDICQICQLSMKINKVEKWIGNHLLLKLGEGENEIRIVKTSLRFDLLTKENSRMSSAPLSMNTIQQRSVTIDACLENCICRSYRGV